MKKLLKIILLFAVIFIAGIYFTIKTINTSYTNHNKSNTEIVTVTSNLINLIVKV